MIVKNKMKRSFSILMLAVVFSSFILKTNCFEAKNIDLATGIEIGFATLKFPLAVAANMYELKGDDKKALSLYLFYLLADLSDSGLKIYNHECIDASEAIYSVYNLVKLIEISLKLNSTKNKNNKKNKFNKNKNLSCDKNKQTILSLLKYAGLAGDSIFSVKFALGDRFKVNDAREKFLKSSDLMISVASKIFANCIDNKTGKLASAKFTVGSLYSIFSLLVYVNREYIANTQKRQEDAQKEQEERRKYYYYNFQDNIPAPQDFNGITYYNLLKVSGNASADELKRAYFKGAVKFHPDRHRGQEEKYTPLFQAFANSKFLFEDSEKRRKYDSFLANRVGYQVDYSISREAAEQIAAEMNERGEVSQLGATFEVDVDVDVD